MAAFFKLTPLLSQNLISGRFTGRRKTNLLLAAQKKGGNQLGGEFQRECLESDQKISKKLPFRFDPKSPNRNSQGH